MRDSQAMTVKMQSIRSENVCEISGDDFLDDRMDTN